MIKMYRVIPQRASISIENEIEDRMTMGHKVFSPRINNRRTTIEFETYVDPCSFKAHPMHGDQIEVQVDETIHIVVLDQYDIRYERGQGPGTYVVASGRVVDSRDNDDHPLKQAVDKAVREN